LKRELDIDIRYRAVPKEKELANKHDSIPRLFIEEPSGNRIRYELYISSIY